MINQYLVILMLIVSVLVTAYFAASSATYVIHRMRRGKRILLSHRMDTWNCILWTGLSLFWIAVM